MIKKKRLTKRAMKYTVYDGHLQANVGQCINRNDEPPRNRFRNNTAHLAKKSYPSFCLTWNLQGNQGQGGHPTQGCFRME